MIIWLTLLVSGFFVFVVVRPYIESEIQRRIIGESDFMGTVIWKQGPDGPNPEWMDFPGMGRLGAYDAGSAPLRSRQHILWVNCGEHNEPFVVSLGVYSRYELKDTVWLKRIERRTLFQGRIVYRFYISTD